ncbi:hypothetical protein [Pontibacter vulgaris]|uniref:hypothetical protein n=1 Tax=Pontibacter vulgaris TaxID=2905679 RepID=UPI001FA7D5BD|nr:hypothetical protein [Pontibacter vulgaris]
MKKHLLSFFLVLGSLTFLQAQDLITKRNGEILQAKVLEVSLNDIKYKSFSNLEGPTYVVPKAEVTVIQYANKTTEAFELPEAASATASNQPAPAVNAVQPVTSSASSVELFNKGQLDALNHYDGYKSAGTGVLVASLVSPLIGLVPAIITSSTPPKVKNLDSPTPDMLNQPDYASGYRKSARKIKSGKVWKNWGIAFGVNLALVLMLSSGSN